MLSSSFYITLHLLSFVCAQSENSTPITTSLTFAPWDSHLSVITADPIATTYLEDNSSDDSDCNAEAYDRVMIVNGPSTAGVTYVYISCGTLPAYVYHIDCSLTEANTATCGYAVSSGNTTQTSTVTQNSSELSGQPVTITAGIEKLFPSPTRQVSALTTKSGSASLVTFSQSKFLVS